MADNRFDDKILVACEVMRPEIERLRSDGKAAFKDVFYVHPGSHERSRIMEEQLPEKLARASETGNDIIVALGVKCYFDLDDPGRNIDSLIEKTGANAVRVSAEDCVDMLADQNRRVEVADGRTIYWMTPGWVLEREKIFEGWDAGKANETFPRHDAVVLVDALDFFNTLSMEDPETLLEFSDWLGTSLEPAPADLARLETLLADAADTFRN